MVIGINPGRPLRYVLEAEQDENGQPVSGATIWLLRPLAPDIHAELAGEMQISSAEDLEKLPKVQLRVLREGLMGWERFSIPGEDGQLVEAAFKTTNDGKPTDDMLCMIPPAARPELASAIMTGSQITLTEKKG